MISPVAGESRSTDRARASSKSSPRSQSPAATIPSPHASQAAPETGDISEAGEDRPSGKGQIDYVPGDKAHPFGRAGSCPGEMGSRELQADRERGAGCSCCEADRVPRPAAEVVGEHRRVLDSLCEQCLRGGTEDLGDKAEAGCFHVGVTEAVGAVGRARNRVAGGIPRVLGWGAMISHASTVMS